MKTIRFFICLFLFGPQTLTVAQEPAVLNTILTGTISPVEHGFTITFEEKNETKSILKIKDLFILEDDLHLELELPGFSAMEKDGAYQVSLEFLNARQERVLPGISALKNANIPHFKGKSSFTIVWRNFVGHNFFQTGSFQLKINLFITGIQETLLALQPAFPSSSKWITGILGGVGLGMVGTGYFLSKKAEDDYDLYKEMVFFENPEAAGQLSQANQKRTVSDVLLVGGGATVAAGTLYFLLKYFPYRKHKKVYDKYNPSANYEVQPFYDLSSGRLGGGGVQFIFHF